MVQYHDIACNELTSNDSLENYHPGRDGREQRGMTRDGYLYER